MGRRTPFRHRGWGVLVSTCRACGTQVGDSARFCPECGQALASTALPGTPAVSPQVPAPSLKDSARVIARMTETGSEVVYDNGGVYLDGKNIGFDMLMQCDCIGAVRWVDAETRVWAQGWAAALAGKPQTPRHGALSTVATPPAMAPATGSIGAALKRYWVAVVVIATAVVLGLGWVVVATNATKTAAIADQHASVDAAAAASANAEGEFLARGVRLVNQSGLGRLVAQISSTPTYGKPHVSIGRSADFNDEVLVTVVWPGFAAYQAMVNPDAPPQTADGELYVLFNPISSTNIDASLTNWNGTVDGQGHLVLNGFERQSVSAN